MSPSTASKDRELKLPLYASYGVRHVWVLDPIARTLEALQLNDGGWSELGRFAGDDRVSIPPFDAITIALTDLWC